MRSHPIINLIINLFLGFAGSNDDGEENKNDAEELKTVDMLMKKKVSEDSRRNGFTKNGYCDHAGLQMLQSPVECGVAK